MAGSHTTHDSRQVLAKRSVWVDFQNITGSTDDLLPQIEQAVLNKGYDLATSHNEADFVLWATLRFLMKLTKTTFRFAKGIMNGAIVGGAAGGVIGYNSGSHRGSQSWTHGNRCSGGAIAGALIGGAIAALNKKNEYQMIMDIQLAANSKVALKRASALATPQLLPLKAQRRSANNGTATINSGNANAQGNEQNSKAEMQKCI